jgi:hypothetical protein
MTLIIKVSTDNASILVGDSLVSGLERDEEIHIPTVGSIQEIFPKGSGWSVRHLKKKIDILGNNIIVGWYGNYTAASVVIGELRRLNNINQLSVENINDFLSHENIRNLVGGYIFNDSNLVGITGFILENGTPYPFDYCSGTPNPILISFPDNLGEINIYGSGAQACNDYLTANLNQITKKFFNADNLLLLVHEFFLGISSNFLTEEILSSSTILNLYGGYFDFAAFVENRLAPKSDYTYFFWEVVYDAQGNPEAKLCCQGMKTRHLTNQITECLSWIAPQPSSSNDSSVARIDASLHYIRSVDASQDEFNNIPLIQAHNLSFNSEYSCHSIVFRDPNGHPNINKCMSLIRNAEPNSTQHLVNIENLGNSLHYKCDENFVTWIENQARQIWS